MPSGRTLLTYGYRRPDWGIRAVLANEECTDIDVANELVVRGDGGIRDLGYPQAWLLNDGRAFVSLLLQPRKRQRRHPIHLRHHPGGGLTAIFRVDGGNDLFPLSRPIEQSSLVRK